jgi:hypothetical protein
MLPSNSAVDRRTPSYLVEALASGILMIVAMSLIALGRAPAPASSAAQSAPPTCRYSNPDPMSCRDIPVP